MNQKDKTVSAGEPEVASLLAPATSEASSKKDAYQLVNLDEGLHHIPRLGREYTNQELVETPGLLKMLFELKWPHVIKN